MKTIRVHTTGGPDALRYEEVPKPVPDRGEALVRIEAIGVNYIDIYHREGLYERSLPFIPGLEGAGVIEAVGSDVSEVRPGDRVAWASVPGGYAEYATAPVSKLVRLPDGIDSRAGAAAMLQGMTAHYLAHATYPLKTGDTALIHAAAGGVGLLLVQMAHRAGARVFGTVSTEEKGRLAREAGCHEVILYTKQDFEAEVKRLADGRGVQVVYDSVGKTTFEKSLNSLAPRGYLVLFGASSGPVPAFDLGLLAAKGSLFVTRPSLVHYTLTRQELLERASAVLSGVASGILKLRIGATFRLSEAAEAHRQLQSRATTGKLLLIP